MTNTNTTDTIRYVNDVLTAVYTFTSIHVLDSAVYQCSAVNGITPVDQGTQQLTLNVNGKYNMTISDENVNEHVRIFDVNIENCI